MAIGRTAFRGFCGAGVLKMFSKKEARRGQALTAPCDKMMRANKLGIDAVRRYCMALPHATESVQWSDNLVFKIGGKMFAVLALERRRSGSPSNVHPRISPN